MKKQIIYGWNVLDPDNDIKNPPPFPPGPYTNSNGYNENTGSGLCVRNEKEVTEGKVMVDGIEVNVADEIKKRDWSFK